MRRILLAVVASCTLLSPALAQDKRVALVIGNAEYRSIVSIKNPANDALDVSEALKKMGFSVRTLINADARGMRRALAVFGNKAIQAEIALMFFSGHGLQSDGVVWLLPVDGQAETLAAVARSSFSLPQVLQRVQGASKLNAVFLDIARADPYNEAAKRNLPAGIVSQIEEPRDLLISYATGAGNVAADGAGRISPFTAALLKHIAEPGIDLSGLMRSIRSEVVTATEGRQNPAFYMTADDAPYFVAPVVKVAVPTAPEPVPVAPPAEAASPEIAPQPAADVEPAPPIAPEQQAEAVTGADAAPQASEAAALPAAETEAAPDAPSPGEFRGLEKRHPND